MIDNLDKIKKLLVFDSIDDFYYLKIIQRKIWWSSLTEYRKSEYASGGWGFSAYKLAKDNVYRDDTEWFYVKYAEYCH